MLIGLIVTRDHTGRDETDDRREHEKGLNTGDVKVAKFHGGCHKQAWMEEHGAAASQAEAPQNPPMMVLFALREKNNWTKGASLQ